MFRCHQNLKCPMDVLAITGKSSNASSRIIELRAGLIRNLMIFKALYFWQLLEKTRWTYLMDSSSSKKLTCKTWGKSWRSLKIFVGETHEAYGSYKFHLRRQEPSETIKAYISSLRQLAKNCNFGVLEDRMIRDQTTRQTRSFLVQGRQKSMSSVSSKRH